MHHFLRLGLLTLAALVAAPLAASANPFTYGILTQNASPNNAWITIQDLGKTRNLDWGTVDANRSREWRSGNYTLGGYYYVRFEFKNAAGGTICDTRMQTAIRGNGTDTGSMVYGHYDPKTGKCYIAQATR